MLTYKSTSWLSFITFRISWAPVIYFLPFPSKSNLVIGNYHHGYYYHGEVRGQLARVFLFHHVSSLNRTQVVRHGSKLVPPTPGVVSEGPHYRIFSVSFISCSLLIFSFTIVVMFNICIEKLLSYLTS